MPAPAPVKSLGERVAYARPYRSHLSGPLTDGSANPKARPKSAAVTKAGANGTKGAKVAGRVANPKGGRNTNRPKAKTTEELDAEMTDYWGNNNHTGSAPGIESTGAVNGAAQPAANGEDLGMDEISVGSIEFIT